MIVSERQVILFVPDVYYSFVDDNTIKKKEKVMRNLVEKLMEQLEMSNYVEKDTSFEQEIKNNVHFIKLKEYLKNDKVNDVTAEISKDFVKVKVESGWLYGMWDTIKDNFPDKCTFVPETNNVQGSATT